MRWLQHVISKSRFLALVAVAGCAVAGITVLLSAARQSVLAAIKAWNGTMTPKAVAVEMIQVVDWFLIATAFYVVAVGLYELFIDDSVASPEWLRIRSLDDLKNKLLRLVVVVLAVDFLGEATRSSGDSAILRLGGAVGMVIAALTLFLRFSGQGPSEPRDRDAR